MHCAAKGTELPPPALPDVAHEGIGLAAASNLRACIQTNAAMQTGDVLELFWGNCFVAAHQLSTNDLDQHISLQVPRTLLHPGVNRVHYRLLKPGYRPVKSPSLQVLIKLACPGGDTLCETTENPALAPLSLAPAIVRHGLDLQRLGPTLPFRIAPYLNMAEGDEITLRWGDVRLDLPALDADAIGLAVHGEIPRALVIEAGADDFLDISYCVLDRVGNSSQWAAPLQVKVYNSRP